MKKIIIALSLAVLILLPQTMLRAAEKESLALFNGKNLDGWYVFLKGRERNEDPKNVFTVKDGLLRVSGEEWGCITTTEEYGNYVIEVEFKTGTEMFAPRVGKAFDSGLLIHSVGEDGAFGKSWMYSIECNIIDGGCGDILVVVPAKTDAGLSVTSTARQLPNVKGVDYDPGGETMTITDVSTRINRIGRAPDWKDVAHFRDQSGVEKAPGEWNVLRCVAEKDTITVYLNGKLVNRAWNVKPQKGRIQIQSEGAEYFFKRIELTPL